MIKENKIIKEEIHIQKQRFCDVCGSEIPSDRYSSYTAANCKMCGKDLCEKCIEHEIGDIGDYRGDTWCKKCWDIGEPFRAKIEVLECEIELLNSKWFELCNDEKKQL